MCAFEKVHPGLTRLAVTHRFRPSWFEEIRVPCRQHMSPRDPNPIRAVRTNGHNHRELAGESVAAEAIETLARQHQSAIWSRQREANALRNAVKDFNPGAPDIRVFSS